jgi:tyrosyl-tRNA synthetase
MNFLEEMQWRGLVFDHSSDLPQALAQGQIQKAYIGFDPTAASLHVGSLLPLLTLARFQKAGMQPIALVGGGTGLIGDPSGKTQERQLLSLEQVQINLKGIESQVGRFVDISSGQGQVVNNADWLCSIGFIEFLRDIGKHFSVNVMLTRDSVKKRIQSEDGISFTEFSYSLLQAYDFYVLNQKYGCQLQMGGSDQWGNIVAGSDLIRRMKGQQAFGLTMPLVTNSNGQKFGKSEAGNVWLDPKLSSPYQFYQFWLGTEDADVVRYLKYFTFLNQSEIQELEQAHLADPGKRVAHTELAQAITKLTHGQQALEQAQRISKLLFADDLSQLSADDVLVGTQGAPTYHIQKSDFNENLSLVNLLASTGIYSSKAEARRAVTQGGVYLNQKRMNDVNLVLSLDHTIESKVMLIRVGKKNYHVVLID